MKDQRENNAQNTAGNAEESQETIADGQYPIMGNSRVTVDEMVDYFSDGRKTLSERSSFQRWSRVYRSVLQDVL